MSASIEKFVNAGWSVATRDDADSPATLRFRRPVPSPNEVSDFSEVLRVLWIYADEGTGALPSQDDIKRMTRFEDDLCDALELDRTAVLAAVLTMDGARQWLLYTVDVQMCGIRINQLPQEETGYPLEIDTFSDPNWAYLREDILGPIDNGT
ncbi:MAG: DUF695 domain-containing protein [Pseudomonadota bacterium]